MAHDSKYVLHWHTMRKGMVRLTQELVEDEGEVSDRGSLLREKRRQFLADPEPLVFELPLKLALAVTVALAMVDDRLLEVVVGGEGLSADEDAEVADILQQIYPMRRPEVPPTPEGESTDIPPPSDDLERFFGFF